MSPAPAGTIGPMPILLPIQADADAAAWPRAARSRARGARDVLVCSLTVTTFAAAAALVASLASDVRWSLAFVVLRWLLVAALLTTPLLHQVAVRLGAAWRMPWVLRTPATALLLTVELVAFDVLSARLG